MDDGAVLNLHAGVQLLVEPKRGDWNVLLCTVRETPLLWFALDIFFFVN
jgi:hypothetical protein